MERPNHLSVFIRMVNLFLLITSVLAGMVIVLFGIMAYGPEMLIAKPHTTSEVVSKPGWSETISTTDLWQAPDFSTVPTDETGQLIRYGRELVVHTAKYLGPQGKAKPMSNGMNCQNCHLEAGTKLYGNNYSAVASTYPKLRARSGTVESIEKRVNDCFERSLNGQALDVNSHEMKAIVAYIKWLGKNVPPGKVPQGAGLAELDYLNIPANPETGKVLYEKKCASCHGSDGQGLKSPGAAEWTYPPLWGSHSYNIGAGMFRLSRLAGYIKTNMPLGATYLEPQLSNEEAWHIAAYVNSMPRPGMDLSKDWPDITQKPIDHPFGPFADGFSEQQHKYGPFKPILEKRNEIIKTKHPQKP